MSERSGRAAAIGARLEQALGAPLAEEPRQLSGGASQETWVFALHGEDGPRRLVLQLLRPDRAADRDLRPALLRAAAAAGVTVAPVVADDSGDEALGSWVVVEHVEGTADPADILAGEGVPPAAEIIDGLAAELAAIHRMEMEGLPHVEDALAQLREIHDGLGEPHPVFELAFRELEAGRPAQSRTTLVHADFRMGNVMVGPKGITAVLDWELAHTGDPLQDLGWLCVNAWRFGRPDRPVAGLGTREQLLDAYARHSGVGVDPADLRWWELFGNLRWGVICVMQAHVHLSGHAQSLEHAVIGRRAAEVEWDLLELLDPGGAAPDQGPEEGAEPPSLHDRPTGAELIDAIRGELGDHVLPALEGRPAFRTRVALRALGMIGRQIAAASRHAALREQVLERLGADSEAELGQGIHAGDFEGRRDELLGGLRPLTRAKLEVANPRHLEPIPTEETEK
jgi:aminoglycoside phosphotransferase (APT) family kinase protein